MHDPKKWTQSIHMPTLLFSYALLALGASLWVWSAIRPLDFGAWAIEQGATLVGIITVLVLAPGTSFDRRSRLAFFAMFCLHTIGTHYTYSLTPYEQVSMELFGSSPSQWFGWERNHYDRFVHFAYGFLMAHPIQQAVSAHLQLGAGVSKFLSLNLILSSSALYELAEWWAAGTFGADVGTAYLGTQGDVWDAQADMALAGAGWLMMFFTSALFQRARMAGKPTGSVYSGIP